MITIESQWCKYIFKFKKQRENKAVYIVSIPLNLCSKLIDLFTEILKIKIEKNRKMKKQILKIVF